MADKSPDDLRRLFSAITSRLSLVVITINEENPFEIFESLNSTGLPLEKSDLIRNYLFMQVPVADQAEFNEDHWDGFERIFDDVGDNSAKAQTVFYRTYLMRNGAYSKAKFTFIDFKDQNRRRNLSPVEQVSEMVRFARFERTLRNPECCENDELRDSLAEIVTLEITTAHPLLMNFMDRLESGQIDRPTFLGCLRRAVLQRLIERHCG